MGVLSVIRRIILREHEEEHQTIKVREEEQENALANLAARLRRLEIEKRMMQRRADR